MNRALAAGLIPGSLVAILACGGIALTGCTGSGAGSPTASSAPSGTSGATPTPGATDPEAVPDEVAVECGPDAPALGSDRVRSTADGVRFVVTGAAGWMLGVTSDRGREGVQLESPPQAITLLVPPGAVRVSCADPLLPGVAPVAPLRVEDPAGRYRPVEPRPNQGTCMYVSATPVQGARGQPGDPVGLAMAALDGLRPGDVVEQVGFPGTQGTARVVRGGEVMGNLTYVADGHGGWLLLNWTICGDLRISF